MKKWKSLYVYCNACQALLFKYKKGGSGALIKIRPSRILENYTLNNLDCPTCGATFAKPMPLRA